MADISNKFRKIMKDIDNNIESQEDKEFVKKQVTNLFMLFLDEIDSLKEIYEEKIDGILQNQSILNSKVEKIETTISNIEKELYIDEESDFEIVCPYCNYEFTIQLENVNQEIECPDCHNQIELSWNDDECGCEHNCGECGSHCDHEDNEDDM